VLSNCARSQERFQAHHQLDSCLSLSFTKKVISIQLIDFLKNFCLFWLHWVLVAACSFSLVAVLGLLFAVASLVAEHRF